MAATIFACMLCALILAAFVAVPLTEMILARRAHAQLCVMNLAPRQENGIPSAHLLIHLRLQEEREENGRQAIIPPFVAPANANSEEGLVAG